MAEEQFGSDAVDAFNGKTISYVYENEWAFTNVFDSATRITKVEGRGTLHEQVEIRIVAPDTYFIAWIDEEMGAITQLVDLAARTLLASVPVDGKLEVWKGTITAFGDAKA